MEFKVLNIEDKFEWNAYLNEIPDSDIYFSPEYYELAYWNNEGVPFCAILKDTNQIILYPFLLNSINEKYKDIQSGYGYGGIISNSSSKIFISSFFELFDEWCREKYVVAEFIRFHPLLNNHLLCQDNTNIILNRKTVYLNLNSGFDNIWMQYDSKCRNIIRKAEKAGYKVESSELNHNNLTKFYDLYQDTMQRVGAKEYYLFSKPYFIKMAELLKGKISLYCVYNGKELAAASLFLYSQSIVNYHLSARDLKYKKYSLISLILHEAIKKSTLNGYTLFHFGGGNSLNKNDSLYRFKKSFSKLSADFYIGTKIHNKQKFDFFNSKWEQANIKIKHNFSHVFLKYRL